MSACREGSAALERALRALDRTFHAVLYRESLRALRDADLAQDLVQETFIRVWQRCASFKGDSELLPWIRAILRNLILDQLRRPEREQACFDDEAMQAVIESRLAESADAGMPRPEEAWRRGQLEASFAQGWQRFEQAAPAHAAVMRWVVEDGLTPLEISTLLGRSPGATREFLSQCRKRARQHLAEWYELAFERDGR
jgi:RNA polymerase sigma-70 factor, ECF subfamily